MQESNGNTTSNKVYDTAPAATGCARSRFRYAAGDPKILCAESVGYIGELTKFAQ